MKAGRPSDLLLGQGFAASVGLITAPILARALGPEGRGIVAGGTSILLLIPVIAGLGLPATMKNLARSEQSEFAITTCRRVGDVGAVLALGAVVMGGLLADVSTVEFVLLATAALAVANLSWACDVSVLLVRGKYRCVLKLQLVQPTLLLMGIVVLTLLDLTSAAAVLVLTGFAGISTLGLSRVLLRSTGPAYSATRLFRRSMPSYPGMLAEAGQQRLPSIAVLLIMGESTAGLLSVATTVAGLVLLLGQVFASASLRHHQLVEWGRVALLAGSFPSCIVAALLGVTAPFTIPVVFGQDFIAAVWPTILLCGGAALAAAMAVGCNILIMAGRPTIVSCTQVITLAATLLGVWLFRPYAEVGGALALTTGYASGLVVCVLNVPKGVTNDNLFSVCKRVLWSRGA